MVNFSVYYTPISLCTSIKLTNFDEIGTGNAAGGNYEV